MVMSMKKHKFLGNALSLVTTGALLLSLCVLPAYAAEGTDPAPAAPFENTTGDGGENYISLCDARTFQAMLPVDMTEEEAQAAAETVVWSLDYDEASGYADPELYPNHTRAAPWTPGSSGTVRATCSPTSRPRLSPRTARST